ncbi:MAG TPA: PH domain-containing protein [Holophagaceae bacterium]|nr:PH domain-containing protein [Holophagaceae bacterium]
MSEVFKASRLTAGNHLFRTVIEVSDQSVVRRKRSWFTVNEMSIHLSRVASVRIDTGLLFADILIESTGGSDPMASHGHFKSDAKRIKELIEQAQGRLAGTKA